MTIVARPYKLKREDTWGICLKKEDNPNFDVSTINVGAEVEVTTKTGKTWNNTVSQVIFVSPDKAFVMCRTEENPPKSSAPQCVCEHCGAKLDARTGKRIAGPAEHGAWAQQHGSELGVPKKRPGAAPKTISELTSGDVDPDELPF